MKKLYLILLSLINTGFAMDHNDVKSFDLLPDDVTRQLSGYMDQATLAKFSSTSKTHSRIAGCELLKRERFLQPGITVGALRQQRIEFKNDRTSRLQPLFPMPTWKTDSLNLLSKIPHIGYDLVNYISHVLHPLSPPSFVGTPLQMWNTANLARTWTDQYFLLRHVPIDQLVATETLHNQIIGGINLFQTLMLACTFAGMVIEIHGYVSRNRR